METIWTSTCNITHRRPLMEDIETEVAVIGAGMAGILIAYLLQKEGKKVVVLEANEIGSGQTGKTTAKITSQHSLIYDEILKNKGVEYAIQYARANEKAIREYEKIIIEQGIQCDFRKCPSYIYSENVEVMKAEAEAARKAGLDATFTTETTLPFSVAGAVKIENQAQFHPLLFIKALAEAITIYENTKVYKVEEHKITTDNATVIAKHIVFACHYPFMRLSGMYFARMHQERSYVITLKNVPQLDGMYLGVGENGYSFRNYGDYLLFGGGKHRTGENKFGGSYERLREEAKKIFPESEEIYHWSAQDCMTSDNIPFIGRFSKGKPNWYIASGFQKWGMTSSMVSAMIIRDCICNIKNQNADVFSPNRFSMNDIGEGATTVGKGLKGVGKRILPFLDKQPKDRIPIKKVTRWCPHLGCPLEWNPEEKTWDCPCHGSRFDENGKLIDGPAKYGIEKK